mmetsp:Transcript_932/g.3507  ORF Transcript_932/g.3507 Transcript_932/m.3507 type:complete len:884 (+) Transcript_932:248-2899(+)
MQGFKGASMWRLDSDATATAAENNSSSKEDVKAPGNSSTSIISRLQSYGSNSNKVAPGESQSLATSPMKLAEESTSMRAESSTELPQEMRRVSTILSDKLASKRGLYGTVEMAGDGNEDESERGKKLQGRNKYVLDPTTDFKKGWDIFQACALCFIAVVVPYRVGFKVPATGPIYWVELAIDLYFVFDVFLNFVTGYWDPDLKKTILDHQLIAKHYIKSWFVVDLMAIIPIDMTLRILDGDFVCSLAIGGCSSEGVSPGDEVDNQTGSAGQLVRLVKLLRLFRLLKLLRLVRLARIFERYQDDLFKLLPLITIAKLMLMLLYLGHVIGCFYNFASAADWRTELETEAVESGELTPWMILEFGDDKEAENAPALTRYVAAMYWAFTTMTTVGYGDISARTVAERGAAIFGMIVGGFMFSYIIGTMAEVISSIDMSRRSHAKKMQCVLAFIKDNQLPSWTSKDILKFFRIQNTRAYSDQSLLEELPFKIRREIVKFKYDDIISQVPIFRGQSDFIIVEVCAAFLTQISAKGTCPFQCGEVAGAVYFVQSGLVDVVNGKWDLDNPPTMVAKLKVGSCFGEEVALGNTHRLTTARTRDQAKLYYVPGAVVLRILRLYPTLRELLTINFDRRGEKLESAMSVMQNKQISAQSFVRRLRTGNAPGCSAEQISEIQEDAPKEVSPLAAAAAILGEAGPGGAGPSRSSRDTMTSEEGGLDTMQGDEGMLAENTLSSMLSIPPVPGSQENEFRKSLSFATGQVEGEGGAGAGTRQMDSLMYAPDVKEPWAELALQHLQGMSPKDQLDRVCDMLPPGPLLQMMEGMRPLVSGDDSWRKAQPQPPSFPRGAMAGTGQVSIPLKNLGVRLPLHSLSGVSALDTPPTPPREPLSTG